MSGRDVLRRVDDSVLAAALIGFAASHAWAFVAFAGGWWLVRAWTR